MKILFYTKKSLSWYSYKRENFLETLITAGQNRDASKTSVRMRLKKKRSKGSLRGNHRKGTTLFHTILICKACEAMPKRWSCSVQIIIRVI